MVTARITGSGYAVPAGMDQQQLWEQFFERHYDGNRTARRVWSSSGVATRHGVVDPRVEDVSRWSTGTRMARFALEALPLGKRLFVAKVGGTSCEAVLDPDGQLSRARCSCSFFYKSRLRAGPCRHLMALKLHNQGVFGVSKASAQ